MLSWCWGDGGAAGTGFGVWITWFLLNDLGIVQVARPQFVFRKQMMQVNERRHRNARGTEFHASADDRIEHPGRNYDYDAGRSLDEDDSAMAALLAAAKFDMTPVQGMPTVMDFYFMPDMGRMNG